MKQSKRLGRMAVIFAYGIAILVIVVEAIAIWNFAPKKPFKDLNVEDIASVYVLFGTHDPYLVPKEEINVVFLGKLHAITFYGYTKNQAPLMDAASGGTAPTWMQIELTNGRTYEIQEGYPYATLNGKTFYTDYYAWVSLRGTYEKWLSMLKENGSPSSGLG